jgi:hypothetical protein
MYVADCCTRTAVGSSYASTEYLGTVDCRSDQTEKDFSGLDESRTKTFPSINTYRVPVAYVKIDYQGVIIAPTTSILR